VTVTPADGSTGAGFRRTVAVAEGIGAAYSPLPRLTADRGLEPAEAALIAPPGMTVSPQAVLIPAESITAGMTCVAGPAVLGLQVTPPYLRMRIEPEPGSGGKPTAWHHAGPLAIGQPDLRRGGALRLDLPGLAVDPPLEVVAQGQVVQVLQPTIQGRYPLRYLRSLLPVRDAAIAAALAERIADSPLLTKGPILEATPPYRTGASLRELIADGVLDPAFARLGGPTLPLDRPLYLHQEQAIRKAAAGRNLVVASGTGSGKTECFLLPVLSALTAEHAAGTLGPGVRALLLYPMNALANDQARTSRWPGTKCARTATGRSSSSAAANAAARSTCAGPSSGMRRASGSPRAWSAVTAGTGCCSAGRSRPPTRTTRRWSTLMPPPRRTARCARAAARCTRRAP